MHCPSCQSENRETAKFCASCGTELIQVCPNCNNRMTLTARFCDACGTKLKDAGEQNENSQSPERKIQTDIHEEAERRQITVMFCDLVGSTRLSQTLDPEELREIIQMYQTACTKIIHQFDGFVAQYLGDGLLAYFGYPQAHEDDAQRAIRSGLGILSGLNHLNERLSQNNKEKLAVRIGIHTGLVVVGEMGAGAKKEKLATGDTPNIAARLESQAESNTILISQETFKIVKGYFDCINLGKYTLKGLSQAIEVFQVLHESGARSRLEIRQGEELSELIGREQEMALLIRHWEIALGGQGHLVLLSGEAGIGKSRLVYAIKEYVAQDAENWLTEFKCSPYHQSSAFYPIIDFLENTVLQFEKDISNKEKLAKLEGLLTQYGFDLPETVPLFAALLSIPFEDIYQPLNLGPEYRKQRIIQIILSILLGISKKQPVLFIVEDIHWIDPSTLELLYKVIEQLPTSRILALFTFRPDFSASWPAHTYITRLPLNRLTTQQIKRMIMPITKAKSLPAEIIHQLISKTDGVPLFVEELTKMVLESGLLVEGEKSFQLTGALTPLAIPSTLKDSLMARLDRISSVKEIAQLGSVIGREFSYKLLKNIAQIPEDQLTADLQKLVDKGMLYQQGVPPQAFYIFKHSLIQDTAYQSLLKRRRQLYHQRVAETIETHFTEMSLSQPEVLANHYTEAGLYEKSIAFWLRAVKLALDRYANHEANSHLKRGLEAIQKLPSSVNSKKQELEFLMILGPALKNTHGYSSKEAVEVYEKAMELCREVGNDNQLFILITAQFWANLISAQFDKTQTIIEKLLKLAADSGQSDQWIEAQLYAGVHNFFIGKPQLALKNFKQVIETYDRKSHAHLVKRYDQDVGVWGMCLSARALWMLGFPEQSLQHVIQGLQLAKELSHPYSLAFAYALLAGIYQLRREPQQVLANAEKAIEISKAYGFLWIKVMGVAWYGWALAQMGKAEEGIRKLLTVKDAFNSADSPSQGYPHFLSFLAEAYICNKQYPQALKCVNLALEIIKTKGERWYEAELNRLKAVVLQNQKQEKDAENFFLNAIKIARKQNAKSWEIRAATSLTRLFLIQGESDKVQALIGPLLTWFSEGLETADLVDARLLLQESVME